MTKAIRTFRGAWIDGRIPVQEVRLRLRNEPGANIDADSIVACLSKLTGDWRFEERRRLTEPEPGQWAGMLAAISISHAPTKVELRRASKAIRELPLKVLAVLDSELFKRAETSHSALLDAIMRESDAAALALLRATLSRMTNEASRIKGKRGPKADVGPPLRCATKLLREGGLGVEAARALAAELLRMCGIPAPKSRSQLAALTAKGKFPDTAAD